ncbi:MAG: hypothetical protein AAFY46_16665 [Planctomycetota bacterium]
MNNRLTAGMLLGIASVFTGMGIAKLERAMRPDSVPASASIDEAEIDALLTDLYACISGPAGKERDWATFERVFAADARMTAFFGTPDGNNSSMSLTPGEYREQIGPRLVEMGFEERETHRVLEVYGHIAHAFSTYQGTYNGGIMKTSVEGINSIQLIKTDSGWKVHSLVWQQANTDLPVPKAYRPDGD